MSDNLFLKIKNTADAIKNVNMDYKNIVYTINRTCPDNVDLMDWAASVAYYLAYDAGLESPE